MKVQRLIGVMMAVGIGLIWVACGNNSALTRSKAKGLIETSNDFKAQKGRISLTPDEVKAGIAAGYWREQSYALGPFLMLTPQGKQFFAEFEPHPYQFDPTIIDTRVQLSPEVLEVTGITDNGVATEKIADFKWSWNFSGLPTEARHLFANHPPRSGQAALKLYDDGWRVEKVAAQ
jgi:hypothetical protein